MRIAAGVMLAVLVGMAEGGIGGQVYRRFDTTGNGISSVSVSGGVVYEGWGLNRTVTRLVEKKDKGTWAREEWGGEDGEVYYGGGVHAMHSGKVVVVTAPYRGVVVTKVGQTEQRLEVGETCGMSSAASGVLLIVGCPALHTARVYSVGSDGSLTLQKVLSGTEGGEHLFGAAVGVGRQGETAVGGTSGIVRWRVGEIEQVVPLPAGHDPVSIAVGNNVLAVGLQNEESGAGGTAVVTARWGSSETKQHTLPKNNVGPFAVAVHHDEGRLYAAVGTKKGMTLLVWEGEWDASPTQGAVAEVAAPGYPVGMPAISAAGGVVQAVMGTAVLHGQPPVDGGCGDWGPYGPCSATCGLGKETRTRSCTAPAPQNGGKGCTCPLTSSRSCEVWPAEWKVGAYGACDTTCGVGRQQRAVSCVRCDGKAGSTCTGAAPPATQQCTKYTYKYLAGSWGPCSEQNCGVGRRHRSISCVRCDGEPSSMERCTGNQPVRSEDCTHYTYQYEVGEWGECVKSPVCGRGTRTRKVTCKSCNGQTVDAKLCGAPPETSQSCTIFTHKWEPGNVGPCSATCGAGTQTITWQCQLCNGVSVHNNQCSHISFPSKSTVSCTAYTYHMDVYCSLVNIHSVFCGTGVYKPTCKRCDGAVMPLKPCTERGLSHPNQGKPCSEYTYSWSTTTWSACIDPKQCFRNFYKVRPCVRCDGVVVISSLCSGNQPTARCHRMTESCNGGGRSNELAKL